MKGSLAVHCIRQKNRSKFLRSKNIWLQFVSSCFLQNLKPSVSESEQLAAIQPELDFLSRIWFSRAF